MIGKEFIDNSELVKLRDKYKNLFKEEDDSLNKITGYFNLGNNNTGCKNIGDRNTGNQNVGNNNTGCKNIGDYNSGNHNTNDYNIGDYNTGKNNNGDRNTGVNNYGNYNTGSYNYGNYNVGNWNTSDFSNGLFNTKEHTITLFDEPTNITYKEWVNSEASQILDKVSKYTTEFIKAEDMSDREKEENKDYELTGGYTKKLNRSEYMEKWWNSLNEYEKQIIFTIPNFNEAKFKKCTGLQKMNTSEKKEQVKIEEMFTDSEKLNKAYTIELILAESSTIYGLKTFSDIHRDIYKVRNRIGADEFLEWLNDNIELSTYKDIKYPKIDLSNFDRTRKKLILLANIMYDSNDKYSFVQMKNEIQPKYNYVYINEWLEKKI